MKNIQLIVSSSTSNNKNIDKNEIVHQLPCHQVNVSKWLKYQHQLYLNLIDIFENSKIEFNLSGSFSVPFIRRIII